MLLKLYWVQSINIINIYSLNTLTHFSFLPFFFFFRRFRPSPQPAVEKDDDDISGKYKKDRYPVNLSPEELAIIESREMQLFRRLRQILRRVVAHLASFRRFAVFTRPVQLDEAPDYYDVIKQPMDLGLIRDKIDSHQYTNVTDFMKVILSVSCFIYQKFKIFIYTTYWIYRSIQITQLWYMQNDLSKTSGCLLNNIHKLVINLNL